VHERKKLTFLKGRIRLTGIDCVFAPLPFELYGAEVLETALQQMAFLEGHMA